ncbi:MAG: CCC motif membrane protein [Bacteroidota bacterium]
MEQKQQLPNATIVLVLGICSIIFGCFFVGLVLGIIGLSLSGSGRKMYKLNPELYEGYGTLNAGYIMSIIGIILGGLYAIYWLIAVAILGGAGFSILQMLS